MNEATRRELTRLRSECGCKAGAAALLVSVGTYVLYSVLMNPVASNHREQIIIGIAVGLAGAVIGKILGIVRARYRYHRLLAAKWQHTMPSGGGVER